MRRLIAALTLLLAAPAGAQTRHEPDIYTPAAAPALDAADVKTADEWRYEIRTAAGEEARFTTAYFVSEARDQDIDVRVVRTDLKTGVDTATPAVFDRNWRRLAVPNEKMADGEVSWGLPDGFETGKAWTYAFEVRFEDSHLHYRWSGHGEVIGRETLTLPSGESFECFRIEYRESSQPAPITEIAFVDVDDPSYAFLDAKITEWYAPAVNRYVERDWETLRDGKKVAAEIETLVKYSRGPAD